MKSCVKYVCLPTANSKNDILKRNKKKTSIAVQTITKAIFFLNIQCRTSAL